MHCIGLQHVYTVYCIGDWLTCIAGDSLGWHSLAPPHQRTPHMSGSYPANQSKVTTYRYYVGTTVKLGLPEPHVFDISGYGQIPVPAPTPDTYSYFKTCYFYLKATSPDPAKYLNQERPPIQAANTAIQLFYNYTILQSKEVNWKI